MGIWNEGERRAWYPPEKLTPSEWTERYRILPPSVAAEAGKLRLGRTPYMTGILDCLNEPGVEEIVFVKPTQIGWSTALESLVGFWIDNDPGPILLVLDSQKTAQEVVDERINPLIENTPNLKSRLSPHAHDSTLNAIKFDSCPLYVGWAGSPGTLARRAVRYVLCDEADKYPSNAGREADPVSLATERTATYGYRRRVLIGSTPTLRTGTVWRAWESSGDKRQYHVPCPHCGEYQTLVFGQIKYPELSIADKNQYADAIEQKQLAYYECKHCQKPIRESHRPKMLARGVWLSENQTIDKDGTISGERPKSKRVGFWINVLYSPWRTFSAIAAEHRRSLNDPGRIQNFRNSWLAEPWEEVVKTAAVEDFRQLLTNAPQAGVVPAWAEYIIASADVQKDRMYWIIRAWGAGYKSQLIAYGVAGNFADLKKQTLETQILLANGSCHLAHALIIDSGYRTDEVYEFAKTDHRIRAVKGDNDSQMMLVKQSTAGNDKGISLHLLNTQLLKDRLSVLRNEKDKWLLNKAVEDVYLQHLASEHKTLIKGKERWETKSSGAANHYLDCEVYSIAGAEIFRVDQIPQSQPQIEMKPDPFERVFEQSKQTSGWLGDTKNWLSR
jgi:phage terminase large subunit GpA-like protein